MSDETREPAESYSAEEIDHIRAKIREALDAVDKAIARRRYWIQSDCGPGWSPSDGQR